MFHLKHKDVFFVYYDNLQGMIKKKVSRLKL